MLLWDFFVWVGALAILYYLGKWAIRTFSKINIESYKDGWVMITGSTAGIGKEFAKEFSRRNFKVLLIARNEKKINEIIREIKKENPAAVVEYLVADFKYSHRDPENFYRTLISSLANYEISILVNNIGVAHFKFLPEQSLDDIEEMLGVNIYPQTMISYHLLPKLFQRYKRENKRSLIMNICAIMDIMITPTASIYSATKIYNAYLSEILRYENSEFIDVATIKPGPVMTDLVVNNHGENFPMMISAESFVSSSLKSLHKGIQYGHWKHAVFAKFFEVVPYQIMIFFVQKLIPIAKKYNLIQ
ncbi:unnamed protein product [Blepharisma stoltei]|uniref:Uncharacterized protein n=1 Tax=Blepharisma stoltei TaxID=1481888 RepID=A0AAU9IK94_9CILI|nr:unnamed protein product [Blepharisma stoltei]